MNPKLMKTISKPEQEIAVKFMKEFGHTILYDTLRQNKDQLKAVYTGYVCHVDSISMLM